MNMVKRKVLFIFLAHLIYAQNLPELTVAREQYSKYDTISLRTAAILYEQVLAKEPQNIEAMAHLAIIYAHFSFREGTAEGLKNPYISKAQSFIQSAKNLAPENKDVGRAESHILLVLGKKREAREIITKLLATEPNNPELNYLLACVSSGFYTDESSEAGAAIKKALELNPKFLWALEDKFLAHLQQGQYSKAQEILKQLEKDYPQYPETKLYRVLFKIHNNDLDNIAQEVQSYLSDRNSLATERVKSLLKEL